MSKIKVMDFLKTDYQRKIEREEAAILRDARRIWPMKEWRSPSEFTFAVTRAIKGKPYSRSRWGLTGLLMREGIYRTDGDRHPVIDFSGYDERVSKC